MRPSEKFEAKAAGQKGSEAWSSHVENVFAPTTQASGFAAGRNREGHLDTLIMQNKANFMRFSPENNDFTKKQTQFKPNLTQFKPNLSQFKPNSKPIKANSMKLNTLVSTHFKVITIRNPTSPAWALNSYFESGLTYSCGDRHEPPQINALELFCISLHNFDEKNAL